MKLIKKVKVWRTDRLTDRPTNRWTDGRTDKAGCRVACTRLKIHKHVSRASFTTLSFNLFGCPSVSSYMPRFHYTQRLSPSASMLISLLWFYPFPPAKKLSTRNAWVIRFFCLTLALLTFSTPRSNIFIYFCTRLYTLLCPSIHRSVGRSVGWSHFYFFLSILFL